MATETDRAPALLASDLPDWAGWVERARAGDRDAFDRLALRFWPELVRLARVVGPLEDAEDLAQETLLAAWRSLGQLRDPTRFLPWLRRSLIRRAARAGAARTGVPIERAPEPRAEPAAGAELELGRLLRVLSPRQRAALYLTEIEGLSAGEAASQLGIAAATVRVHRFLALRKLAALLGGLPK